MREALLTVLVHSQNNIQPRANTMSSDQIMRTLNLVINFSEILGQGGHVSWLCACLQPKS